MPALFITGTDTGVGKTVVTACLTRALRSLGADCVAMKPFASGCEMRDGALFSEDAATLQEVGGFELPPDLICPIRLELPLAPLVAAELSRIETKDWPIIARTAFDEVSRRHEWVLVEGVGGWCVPLYYFTDEAFMTCGDLSLDWRLFTIVVARRTLGTINHTILTCRAVRQEGFLQGVVFCDAVPVADDDLAAQSSRAIACELGFTRELGFVPHSTDWNEAARALEPLARELLAEKSS